jgi:hypothetical protein
MKNVWAFLYKYPEVMTIPMSIVIWIVSVWLLRWIDNTAGIYDPGVFQIPLFAIFQLFLFISVSWLVIYLVFGTVRRYLRVDFKKAFNKLSVWEKTKLCFAVFFGLLFALVWLSHTLSN